jgi:hypothetical protein
MWMLSVSTDPDIQHLLLHYLRSWWDNVGPSTYVPPALLAPILDQQFIGWNRCLEGWLSNKWTVCQQHYYEKMNSRRSGKWWISGLIQKLWEVAWDLWVYWSSILHHQENCVSIEKEHQSKCTVIKLFNKLLTKNLLPRDQHLLKLSLGGLLKKNYLYRSQ